ncbi:Uncharacterised protein [uncultured archaeon]|nr:Uncharacterised protein [uncultured archaeon]
MTHSYDALLEACRNHMRRIGYNEKLGYKELTDEQVIHIALRSYNAFLQEGFRI